MQPKQSDCSCEDAMDHEERSNQNRDGFIHRLQLTPITCISYLNQTNHSERFYFQTPLSNVVEARLEMVWSQGVSTSSGQPMVALHCADLTAYQRSNSTCDNVPNQEVVQKNSIVWLQPVGTLVAPNTSQSSRIIWQNAATPMRFMVPQSINYLNFRLDSYPAQGYLDFISEESPLITWRLITKHMNTG